MFTSRLELENRNMTRELAELKSSFCTQEQQLNSLKTSLNKATKGNHGGMKRELEALRKKVQEQNSEIDELYESQDDIEQYTRKNSLELHGIPENDILLRKMWFTVIKLGEVLNSRVKI